MEISRRDFMKGLASISGLIALDIEENMGLGMTRQEEKGKIRRYMKKAKEEGYKYNKEWAEAIEENELRKEIAGTIGEYTRIVYSRRLNDLSELEKSNVILVSDSEEGPLKEVILSVRRNGKEILKDNLPIENLRQIRDCIKNGPPNKNRLSIYFGRIDI